MHILIVFTHPARNSYSSQILDQLRALLLQQNYSVEVSDLYAQDFKSDMTEQEYERESSGNAALPVAKDVAAEHEKINRADCIIFLYPLWWSDCPAKLKGWFDRVWSVGFAYKHTNNAKPMRTVKYGVALFTAGYTQEFLTETQMLQSMEKVMLDDRFGIRFTNKEMIALGGTLDINAVKHQHTKQLMALVDNIKQNCG